MAYFADETAIVGEAAMIRYLQACVHKSHMLGHMKVMCIVT